MAMNNLKQLPIDKQTELIKFFSPQEIEDLHRQFKIIYQMASFETVSDLGNKERGALYSFYNLIELLDEIKNTNL